MYGEHVKEAEDEEHEIEGEDDARRVKAESTVLDRNEAEDEARRVEQERDRVENVPDVGYVDIQLQGHATTFHHYLLMCIHSFRNRVPPSIAIS